MKDKGKISNNKFISIANGQRFIKLTNFIPNHTKTKKHQCPECKNEECALILPPNISDIMKNYDEKNATIG